TKQYEYGDPFQLDLHRTIRNAIRRNGPQTPVQLSPDDFEIERTEHMTRSSTVLMLDLSMSMPMRDNFLPAKKVAMALHALITSQFPRDYMGIVGFSETAYKLTAAELPEVSWDFAYGTNMHHGFTLARQMLARQTGTKQIIMITDGEPTAHITPRGDVFFNYPPVQETIEATLREAARCTREGIRINTFMLDADYGLKSFVEQLTAVNRGRAFFTNPETLGDYVLVDFIEHKRQLARGRGGRRSA
ncbi:MAG: VWA domain-containing protein, partial [Ilumatobacteraceae bacterium]